MFKTSGPIIKKPGDYHGRFKTLKLWNTWSKEWRQAQGNWYVYKEQLQNILHVHSQYLPIQNSDQSTAAKIATRICTCFFLCWKLFCDPRPFPMQLLSLRKMLTKTEIAQEQTTNFVNLLSCMNRSYPMKHVSSISCWTSRGWGACAKTETTRMALFSNQILIWRFLFFITKWQTIMCNFHQENSL